MKNSSFARTLTSVRILLGLVVCSALNQSVAFAAPPLLYDPQSLQQALTQANPPVILDVRTMDAYAVGHIPTARWIDANLWRDTTSTATGLTDQKFWSDQLAATGLTLQSNVVVVGDSLPEASRAWWLLGYLGLKNVAVLDGGHAAWVDAGFELSTESATVTPTQPQIDFQSQRLAESKTSPTQQRKN